MSTRHHAVCLWLPSEVSLAAPVLATSFPSHVHLLISRLPVLRRAFALSTLPQVPKVVTGMQQMPINICSVSEWLTLPIGVSAM